MTCIVGFIDKKNKKAIIGADSAGVAGLDITIRKDKKVFQVGEFIIGCTSSFRMIQLLQFSFTPPKVYDKDIYEYMCTDFINAVRNCFKDGGYLQKYSDGDEKGGTFLVAYKDRLFKVSGDFQVGEAMQGYDACGCGDSYALGSIFNTNKTNANTIVLDALKTAEYFSGGVSEPFFTYCT
jgi:ATP-dependent protease HslVU (ClpYQ) peptidase subunit